MTTGPGKDAGPETPPPGCNLLMCIIILVVVAAFAFFAWAEMPISAPRPVNTGVPPVAPAGGK